jgi:hypothetical protein
MKQGNETKGIALFFILFAVLMIVIMGAVKLIELLPGENNEVSIIRHNLEPANAAFIACALSLCITLLVCKIFRPILLVIIFLVVQAVCSLPMGVISAMNPSTGYSLISVTLIVSSILIIYLLHLLKFYRIKHITDLKASKKTVAMGILAGVVTIFAADMIYELVTLDDNMENQFLGMSKNVVGVVALTIVGPVCEEMVFRGAMLHSMLKRGMAPWSAILTSSMIFGLIHANPAQIPYAFLLGLVLTYLAYKTRSIIPSVILHVINNSFAVVMRIVYGQNESVVLKDVFGDMFYYVLTLFIVVAIGLLYVFRVMEKWKNDIYSVK